MSAGPNSKPNEQRLPAKLYKFISKDYVDGFTSGASIRLGTLADFRRIEAHKGKTGEAPENAFGIKGSGSVRRSESPEPVSGKTRLQKLGLRIGNDTFSTPKALADVTIGGPSTYVLCTSLSFSPDLAAEISPDYDRCIPINNPAELAKAIGRGLRAKFGMRRTSEQFETVKYGERVYRPANLNLTAHPFLKSNEYEKQDEFRFAFHDLPYGEPFNLSCDASAAHMEIIWSR